MSELTALEPVNVFHYFEEICKVPRPSKKEEKIIAYLMKFAEEQGLKAKKDEAGNIVNDYNYVQYLSTTDYQLGIQKLSRRSLGDQIRCVRDINAVD